jgi:hypothetical protein
MRQKEGGVPPLTEAATLWFIFASHCLPNFFERGRLNQESAFAEVVCQDEPAIR